MTPQTLTPAELDELAALEAKATPGEWSAIHVDDDSPDGGPGHTTMMPMAALTTDADCSFVAALRNHAGPLLAMARRLGELQYRWGEFSASNLANLHSLNAQLTAATARAAELDAALTTALADAEMAEHAHDACEDQLTAATARADTADARAQAAEKRCGELGKALQALAHSHDGFHTVDCHAEGSDDDEVCRADHSEHPLECAEPHCDCGATAGRDEARAALAAAKGGG